MITLANRTMRGAAVAVVGALLLWVSLLLWVFPAHAVAKHRPVVSITDLSGRADLVSGGSALLAVSPASVAHRVRVTVDGRSVTRRFAIRGDGRFEGLVVGLRLGPNVVRATLRDGPGALLTLVNHRIGGPIFSGPQLEPWTCQPTAVDKQCDQPPTFKYLYMSPASALAATGRGR